MLKDDPQINTPESHTVFGRYHVQRLLGEGAMGRVYLAEDPVLERLLAIKVIAVDKHTDSRTREEFLQRFSIEARACAKLNHPSIVTVFDAGEERGLPWIAFEYIDGEALDAMLSGGPIEPVGKVISILLDIAAALHHAHECGIIHRDIKPANILIDRRTGIAKLSDFGVVKAPWVALTQDGSAVGSPGYMAPEQLDGSGADCRSDLFSLGIVLYQMMSGKHPFLRKSIPEPIFATLHNDCTPLSDLRPATPAPLAQIVENLLEPDRNKRIRDAAELLRRLHAAERLNQTSASVPAATQSGPRALHGNATRLRRIRETLKTIGEKSPRSPDLKKLRARFFELLDFTANHGHKIAARVYEGFLQNRPRRARFLMIPAMALLLAAALLIVRAIAGPSEERSILKSLHKEGWRGSAQKIADSCELLLEMDKVTEAKNGAIRLANMRSCAISANLVLLRAALRENDDSAAAKALLPATASPKWKTVRDDKLDTLIAECRNRLRRTNVEDSAFLALLARNIFENRKDTISSWMKSEQYWQRWNSVAIAAALGMKVDSVALYILDLRHAGSIRTRKRAATRLGELGDRRAVEPLKQAGALGFRDPVLSYTAQSVLETYFGDSIAP